MWLHRTAIWRAGGELSLQVRSPKSKTKIPPHSRGSTITHPSEDGLRSLNPIPRPHILLRNTTKRTRERRWLVLFNRLLKPISSVHLPGKIKRMGDNTQATCLGRGEVCARLTGTSQTGDYACVVLPPTKRDEMKQACLNGAQQHLVEKLAKEVWAART